MRSAITIVVSLLLILTACGGKISGKYQDANGLISLEFTSGKVNVSMLGQKMTECDYEVKGDKIIITAQGERQSLVLSKNDDGTLQGPMGKLTKVKS